MPTTNLEDLHDAIANAIRGITPDLVRDRVHAWNRVQDPRDVGKSLRVFCVEIEEDDDFPEGGIFTSGAMSMQGTLLIHTGYSGMTDPMFRAYKSEDRKDLYNTITTAAITGLEMIRPMAFAETEDSESGSRAGAHRFYIQYLLDATS